MGVSGPGRVLVSSSVHDVLPGAGITFVDAGSHRLKGLDGEMHLYEVTAVDGEPVSVRSRTPRTRRNVGMRRPENSRTLGAAPPC
jgi:class 3 adenylate cyclase